MNRFQTAVIFLGLFSATALAQTLPGTSAPIDVSAPLVIGQGGNVPIHVIIAQPKIRPATPMPAVLWIHGGGWRSGDYRNNGIGYLAGRGFFTVSVDYRLSGQAIWPAQLEDCRLAVRWLRANAASYNIDPDHIGCAGASAGGHLCTCLATMADQTQFDGTGGYPGVSSRVQAVVDFCGPIDFTKGNPGLQMSQPGSDNQVLVELFGGTFQQKAWAYQQGSPIRYVQEGNPPFLIFHGDSDNMVPPEQAEELTLALQRAHVPVEYVRVQNGGHDLNDPTDPPTVPSFQEINQKVLDFFNRTLRPHRRS